MIILKGMELTFNLRELDERGVCEESEFETKNLEEAITTLKSLLSDPEHKKWVIVATSEDEK